MTLPKPLGLEFQEKISHTIIKKRYSKKDKVESEVVEETEEQRMKRTKHFNNYAAKLLMQMNLTTDPNGNIYFNDLLFILIKRIYTSNFKIKSGSIS